MGFINAATNAAATQVKKYDTVTGAGGVVLNDNFDALNSRTLDAVAAIAALDTAVAAALALKANLNAPTFQGPVTITPDVTYGAAQTPGQTFCATHENSFATGGVLGFQFTTSVDGRITHLACYSINTATYTVTIKQGATVIASLAIVGTNSGWQRVAITPVSLPAGTYTCTYTMTGTTTCIYGNGGHAIPYNTGSFTINEGYTGSTNMSYISLCDLTFEASTTQTLTATYPSFASNAAAAAGGLSVGNHYRQGDFVAVVH